MDYGHDLLFGTFLTPAAANPQQVVQLAQLSEQLGYDLATFQDHPYQPRFLDTWTLMSYVAASTTTIQIAPNVTSLPMRPAPVLARAAASLDLLSGGRLNLGLGAGAFWDAIEAMGVPRLTAGESVEALEEAIDLIRELWAAGERGAVHGGEHYPVHGAKRGPAPAHDVPIWLGAYKPRMLRLTGRKADGWLPSLGYMKPGDIAAGNARIDDAASGVGRHPGEVRRLLNISGGESADQLIELALQDGMSAFIVSSDDPALLQRFAAETIPAVREAVAAERTRVGVAAPGRSAAAISRRREGIAYDDVPASLQDTAIEPGDFAYRTVRSTYLRGGSPGIVLRPRNVAEVADAVAFARRHRHLPFGIRSGGHGVSGRSTNDGGIVVDLGALAQIEVLDPATRRVRIGPGARWMQVARALEPHGWAISSGDYGGVGVGGLATAGGIGFLAREHGLTIDRMVAADVLLADGTVVRASADENPDLFWAVRGAGANVGIVVAFEFEASPVGDLGWVQLAFDATDLAGFVRGFGATMQAAPRDVTLFAILTPGRDGQPPIAQVYGVVDHPDPDTIIQRLQPFAQLAPLVGQSVQLSTYATVMANAADAVHNGQGEPRFRSGLLRDLDAAADAIAALVASGASPWFQIRSVGGAVADVPADATAYAHRDAAFSVTAISFESRTDPALIEQAFPPATLARLRDVKRRYDPEVLFRDNFSVA
ncbi:LLM class flavin-dependent oxidoreductase [Microbacterium sp. zg-YB36]|uniref:LLM class flavin-dependent oxidoreductase n=1 Tax=Microbacterium sp. zg-YB36 TaxID=2969407 RepID=UPI00214CD3B7|nr:LLM class flavin-dependent oxidoreductase [Microbacterium sp. zg-YB36]MDL5351630.1 LLM class flavin-dependent oxidoreductase [Microbacterium sp. zg-YB36]